MTTEQKRSLRVLKYILMAAVALQHSEERVPHDRLVRRALVFGNGERITADEVNAVMKQPVELIVWPR
jgi:hypothetical protein